MRKPAFRVVKPGKIQTVMTCSASEASYGLGISGLATVGILFRQQIRKALIRLHKHADRAAPLLLSYSFSRFYHETAHNNEPPHEKTCPGGLPPTCSAIETS